MILLQHRKSQLEHNVNRTIWRYKNDTVKKLTLVISITTLTAQSSLLTALHFLSGAVENLNFFCYMLEKLSESCPNLQPQQINTDKLPQDSTPNITGNQYFKSHICVASTCAIFKGYFLSSSFPTLDRGQNNFVWHFGHFVPWHFELLVMTFKHHLFFFAGQIIWSSELS